VGEHARATNDNPFYTDCIVSIVQLVGQVSGLIKGYGSANREAQNLANLLDTTASYLTTFRNSLNTVHRSRHFLDVWSGSANDVLMNLELTFHELGTKLGGHGTPKGGLFRLRAATASLAISSMLIMLIGEQYSFASSSRTFSARS
jgi:hypothetical protein